MLLNFWYVVAVTVFLFAVSAAGKLANLKVCVIGEPKLRSTRTVKYCEILGKSKESPVSCVYRADRAACFLAVSRREADFGVFEPEDLYLATQWPESSVLVVSEIRGVRKKPFEYGAVALVRKDSEISGIGDLRGKKLCHPGTESGPEWSPLFAEYFEERVAPADCEKNLSVFEDRIKATSNFFGSACKAGPWTSNPLEDARLKKKYWNLCSLCDYGDCRTSDKYHGNGGSIICLKDEIGDVLWVRYEDVKTHLKVQFLGGDSSDPTSDFYFLCDDGTLMSLTSEDPCFWLAKPWQVVIASRKSATDVQKTLGALADEDHDEWEENLLHVIELYLKYVVNVEVARTPEDYLMKIPGYLSASAMSEDNCRPWHSVKLCVSSALEALKCDWISKTASSLAVRPSLECIRCANLTACLDSVAKKESDVVVVPPDYFYDAGIKFKLKTIFFETGNHLNDSYLVSIVTKKKSDLKSLSDTRGKRICLSKRGGIGWNSLLSVLRKEGFIDSECGGDEEMSKFFGKICFKNGGQHRTCCPGMDSSEKDDVDVLHCLQKDGCDVAVVDFNSLRLNLDGKHSGVWSKDWRPSDLRPICRSDKSSECYWMWSYPNYLMTHAESNSPKGQEIFNVFFQINRYFGKNSKKKNNLLEIFGPFHQNSDVLFRDTSTSFMPVSLWNHSNNYLETVERIKICSNSPLSLLPSLHLLLTVSVFVPFICYNEQRLIC